MAVVSFVSIGRPRPKGSYRARGDSAGLPYVTAANGETLRLYENQLRCDAIEAMRSAGLSLFEGAILVKAHFFFSRPTSHYCLGKNAGRLRPAASRFHVFSPDLDKVCRAAGDSLSGCVFRDDRQIVEWRARRSWTSGYARTCITAGELRE